MQREGPPSCHLSGRSTRVTNFTKEVIGAFREPEGLKSISAISGPVAVGKNLDFTEGRPGEPPPNWLLGVIEQNISFATTLPATECKSAKPCAELISGATNPEHIAFLYQVVKVMLYRGKKFRLTAEVAADVAGKPNAAKLLARVHTDSGGTSFRDDMGENPIAVSNWSRYEINGEVSPAARDMEFGVQLIGPGRAFVRAVSLQFMD